MDCHQLFNRKLIDFADDLQNLRSMIGAEIPEIDAMSPAITATSAMFPTKPQELFHEYVSSKFEQHIVKQDDEFFLNQKADDLTGETNTADLVGLLKKIWGNLSVQNKNAIWKHLQVLLILDKKCRGVL
jgi:hypothetical protein